MMRIAIYTGNFLPAFNKNYSLFLDETIKQVIASHPEHEFVLLSDQPAEEITGVPSNCTWTYLQTPPDNAILLKWWLSITIPSVLKKINTDFFISTCVVSGKSKIDQCLLVPGLQYMHYPELFSKAGLFFFSRHMRGFLRKASSVLVPSALVKNILTEKYDASPEKIFVLPYCPKKTANEKNTIKNIAKKLAGEKLYFFAPAERHITNDLLNLLKAFSIFKKIQQSSAKLVLYGKVDDKFNEQLSSYKYRKDVIIYQSESVEEEKELISSAYAIILSSAADVTGIYTITAMEASVPVVSAVKTAAEEIAGDTALYFVPGDYTELASRMMELYKDEDGRKKLIQKGIKKIAAHLQTNPVVLLWQVIQKGLK